MGTNDDNNNNDSNQNNSNPSQSNANTHPNTIIRTEDIKQNLNNKKSDEQ